MTYFENSGSLPFMMFESGAILDEWIKDERGLQTEKLRGAPFDKMRRVHGNTRPGRAVLSYDQIWVKASYRGYRDPFVSHHAARDKLAPSEFPDLHADHVINRARLRDLPDAWVVLFPVYGKVNSRFGSSVEKGLPPLPTGIGHAVIDPLPAFKLLCDLIPRTEKEFSEQMNVVTGWFASDDENTQVIAEFLADMRLQVRQALKLMAEP